MLVEKKKRKAMLPVASVLYFGVRTKGVFLPKKTMKNSIAVKKTHSRRER